MINSLELFSGAGGLAKGLELAGAVHCGYVEFNRDACKTLRNNYSADIIHETDVRKFDFNSIGHVDFIAGGPPCQPFSMGGKAKGKDDSRDMFPQAIRAIRTKTPKAFLFENVKGLLRASFADYFEYIILQLSYPEADIPSDNWQENLAILRNLKASGKYDGLKYQVQYHLVNAADYGVPQKRERVLIVGIREDLNINWSFPQKTHSRDALYWQKYVTGEYWKKHGITPSEREKKRIPKFKAELIKKYGMLPPSELPWTTMRDAFVGLPCPIKNPNFDIEHTFRPGAKLYPGHTGSEIDEPSKTIKAGAHGVPGGENLVDFCNGNVRYLTIFEAKRIQTFPDEYRISGAWTESMRQLGNAVPVKLAQIIGESLFKVIFDRNTPDSNNPTQSKGFY